MFGNILISMKQTVTIDAWVARDKNGNLGLHIVKPTKEDNSFVEFALLNMKNEYPEVTFENSPKKVKVTIELEDEL